MRKDIDQLIYEASKELFPAINLPIFRTGRNSVSMKTASPNQNNRDRSELKDNNSSKSDTAYTKPDSNQKAPTKSHEKIDPIKPEEQSDG